MRIIFMGTPDFAVSSLEALIKKGHQIEAVFCQPDKAQGRGKKIQMPPVKQVALEHNITVHQPLKVSDTLEEIKAINPDCIVVVAYGKLLPESVLSIPKYGCVNVHGSLLPKYRGAAPIQWAVLDGQAITGITTMLMAKGMDTGDMLLKEEVVIKEDETSGELFDRLKDCGATLLIKTLNELEKGSITPQKQDESLATHAPMISKDLCPINWNLPAREINNKIRGLNPWPTATAIFSGVKMKIHRAKVLEDSGDAGKIFVKDGYLCVYCKEGSLALLEIQMENAKRMDSKSYLLGHPVNPDVDSFELI